MKSCFSVGALLLLPWCGGCQIPASNTAINDLTSRVNELTEKAATKVELAALEKKNATVDYQLIGDVGQLGTKLREFQARFDQDIPPRMDRINAELKDTNQRFTTFENSTAVANRSFDSRLRNLEGDGQTNIQRRREQETGFFPETPPNLPPSESLPDPSAPTPTRSWGLVRIENKMTTWQYIEVNGNSHGIAPQSSIEIIVPAGPLTTRLINYEPTKTWWVGAPDYFQSVVISPKPVDESLVYYQQR